MGDTSISWTDKTWNPIRGCSRVSEGCRNCYAERVAARFSGPGQAYEGLAQMKRRVNVGERDYRKHVRTTDGRKIDDGMVADARWTGEVRFVAEHLADPLRWRKPQRVFVNSMSDLFHEKLTNEQIAAVFGVMAACPQHTFQVLTKRAKRMREWFEWVEEQREVYGDPWATILRETTCSIGHEHAWERQVQENLAHHAAFDVPRPWPLPNVWLGVSVENQDAADERIPELLRTPAAVRFLSCEPLLGQLLLDDGESSWLSCNGPRPTDDEAGCCESRYVNGPPCFRGVDWVIAGCESGPGARPCDVAWLRSLRDQCASAGVPYFLKQAQPVEGAATITDIRPIPQVLGRIGEVIPVLGVGRGSKEKGRGVIELPYLDGVQHAAFPESDRG